MTEWLPLQRRDATVVAAGALTPSVRGLTLEVSGDEPFPWLPGQYLTVRLAGVLDEKRDYSIANAPYGDHPRIELAVTRVEGGPFSSALHALPVGAPVAVQGPSGFFVREDAGDAPVLLVGTGTGLAPLRAMLQAELRARPADGPPLVLLAGVRGEADILWRDELDALARAHPRFRHEVTLSRGDAAWTGRRGYVQAHLAELAAAQGTQVYVCGLSHMVRDVRAVLKDALGFDRKRVHSERYD